MQRSFDLAPMSGLILWLTVGLWLLPVAFAVAALSGMPALWMAAALLIVIYALVWLAARPQRFEADAGGIAIRFPTWTRTVGDVVGARIVTARELREAFGLMLRVGVGGLWGGFGWLWTTRRGLVEFYVSRTDGLVLLERREGRPLLITPVDPAGLASTVAPRA